MKKFKSFFLLLFLTSFTYLLFAQQPSSNPGVQKQQPVKLATPADTVQYTLGAYIGQWLTKNGFAVRNKDLFLKGMDDVLQKRKLAVSDSSIAQRVSSYQLTVQNARSKAMEEQLFATLKGKAGIGVLPDGIHYLVLKAGSGMRPAAKDTIVINAIGIFPDGTVFEDTFKKKRPITTTAGNLIPGLNETVQLMPEGSVWRVFIPSMLGYGPAGLPNVIPPNSALIFDVTLVQVKGRK